MPRLIITEAGARGLERCRQFLREKSPEAAKHAAAAIQESLNLLILRPEAGRPWGDRLDLREILIPFGDSGYVELYRYDQHAHAVYILAFRHQKEAGY